MLGLAAPLSAAGGSLPPAAPRQREAAPIQLPTFSDSIIYQSRPGGGEQSPPEGQSGEAPGKAGSQGSTVSSSYSGGQPDPSWDEPFSLSLSQLAGALWLAGVTVVVLWAGLAHLRFLCYLRRWSSPVVDSDTVRIFNQLGDSLGGPSPSAAGVSGAEGAMLAGLLRPVLLLPQDKRREMLCTTPSSMS